MGNCFSSEKDQAGQTAPNVPREKEVSSQPTEKINEKSIASSEAAQSVEQTEHKQEASSAPTATAPSEKEEAKEDTPDTTSEAVGINDVSSQQSLPEGEVKRQDSGMLMSEKDEVAAEAQPEQSVVAGKEEEPVASEVTAPETPSKPTAQTAEDLLPTTSAGPSDETNAPSSSPPKSTPILTQLDTTLSPSSEQPTTTTTATASAASPTSADALQETSTTQTTPPTSAVSPFTTEAQQSSTPPSGPDSHKLSQPLTIDSTHVQPLAPSNTSVDPIASLSTPISPTLSTFSSTTPKEEKRTSRLSRMFSVGSSDKKNRNKRTSVMRGNSERSVGRNGNTHAIAEEKESAAENNKKSSTPSLNTNTEEDGKRPGTAGSNGSGSAQSPHVISPTVEGRKWKESEDNESLFCY